MSSAASRAVRKRTGVCRPGLPQPADDAEAVQARHHHVEHQQVGAERVGQREGLLPVGRRGHLEARVAQAGREQLADVGLVVHDEQPGLGGGPSSG